ncbi:MAG: SDR family oxidoreductase [Deltaproteobacteria bacterium]|jgi:cyclic-di-GMP-binding biofilm dispersal mediator protein|nr:SDR family oxidoreductase [Deltaproteobacteria bacterium]MBW2500562.1 SDR family oxidoreductase [Deltaproteobacteria bacterium]
MKERRNLDGASIVLAGATGRLGREIGARLVKAGARLVLFGRNEDRLAELDLPGQRVCGDIADAEACGLAVATAIEAYGRLDGVVNATGVVAFGLVEELDDETVDELLATNLLGPLRLAREALPKVEKGGFIANLSAVVAEAPVAGMAFYSATKAALTALDTALAREARRRRVDVLDLRPPHTETGLADRPIAGDAPKLPEGLDPDAVAERIVKAIESREREVASSDF